MSSELLIRSCVSLSWQCVVSISGTLLKLHHMPLWHLQEQLYFFFVIFILCLHTGGMVTVAFEA